MTKTNWFAIAIFLFSLLAAPASLAADDPVAGAGEMAQIDINSADAAAIAAALDGVGLVKAQEIVAYREMFGAFKTIDELMEVKGIGPGTLERNRDRIVLESE
ncbi:MAG: hypothetical protein F4Y89_06775 [Gammaproteobacteria bacterium]|nr:hypothetical protein [Gammaproteobacteria bacterium]MXY90231.1 hypothetical protein [Gammaproteobacteria bacterium]MYA36864.1 hypothetical protein [Gammaproteobacteria bacterium]MYE28839.1 hypothetical protein [Gammaproteobacteria bacterium]MYG97358.1 hypothetical protein [Gammaproteobacteria bacterium]